MTSESIATYLSHLLVARLLVTGASTKAARYPYELEGIPVEPRIVLIRKGKALLQFEQTEQTLTEGSLVYLPPWARRRWYLRRGMRVEWIVVRFTAVKPFFLDATEPLIRRNSDLPLEDAAFQRIAECLAEGGTMSELLAEGELKAVLARFLTSLEIRRATSESATHSAGMASIDRAMRYIVENYHEPDVLNDLPSVAKLHPNYFRQLFRKRTGLTPGAYVIQIRMRAARYFQSQSSMRVKEVAAAVGYNDQFYFSRIYRRYWGHSPVSEKTFVD